MQHTTKNTEQSTISHNATSSACPSCSMDKLEVISAMIFIIFFLTHFVFRPRIEIHPKMKIVLLFTLPHAA